MLKQFLDSVSWFDLPLIATLLFVAMFLTVIVRVLQRARRPEYERMASLPLESDAVQENEDER